MRIRTAGGHVVSRWSTRVPEMDGSRGAVVSRASGLAVSLAGLGFTAVGLWARGEVRATLARERIVSTPDATPPSAPVTSGPAARSMAEVIRRRTLDATGGRTYGETELFLDADRNPTSDPERALKDERGEPVENPDHALWLESTTLQTPLMQAYVASRLAELTIGLGATFVAVGIGLAAAADSRR